MKKRILIKLIVLVVAIMAVTGISFADEGHADELTKDQIDTISGTVKFLSITDNDEILVSFAEGTEKRVYFLYTEDEMVGVYFEDPENQLKCFITDTSPVLLEMLKDDNCEAYVDNGIYVRLGEEIYCVSRAERKSAVSSESYDEVGVLTETNWVYTTITKSVAIYLTDMAAEGYFASVNYVENDDSPYDGEGICWAASGAAIINKYRSASYTALSLWYHVQDVVGGNPVGNEFYEKFMFSLGGGLGYTYDGGKATYSQVTGSLSNGSPLMTCFGSADNVYRHAVVLCGSLHIATSYGYIYMDPNVSGGYVVNYQPYTVLNSSSINCCYYAGGVAHYVKMNRNFRNFHIQY